MFTQQVLAGGAGAPPNAACLPRGPQPLPEKPATVPPSRQTRRRRKAGRLGQEGGHWPQPLCVLQLPPLCTPAHPCPPHRGRAPSHVTARGGFLPRSQSRAVPAPRQKSETCRCTRVPHPPALCLVLCSLKFLRKTQDRVVVDTWLPRPFPPGPGVRAGRRRRHRAGVLVLPRAGQGRAPEETCVWSAPGGPAGSQGGELVKAGVVVQTPQASGSRRPAGRRVGATGASQVTGCVDSSGRPGWGEGRPGRSAGLRTRAGWARGAAGSAGGGSWGDTGLGREEGWGRFTAATAARKCHIPQGAYRHRPRQWPG